MLSRLARHGRIVLAVAAALAVAAGLLERAPPPAVGSAQRAGKFLPLVQPSFLPALAQRGAEDDCSALVEVQNLGREPGKVLLLVWRGGPEGCGSSCWGPAAMACSGLLGPGSSWRFDAQALTTGGHSAALFSLSARTLVTGEITPPPGWTADAVVADVLCELVNRHVVDDCAGYQAFLSAHAKGLDWMGLPLGRAHGPEVAVSATRRCVGDSVKTIPVSADYSGIDGDAFGRVHGSLGLWSYFAQPVLHGLDGRWSVLYVQNADVGCASVDVWLLANDACNQAGLCRQLAIEPGASATLDIATCTPTGWSGTVWLNSHAPAGGGRLAVAVDTFGDDTLETYDAAPADLHDEAAVPPDFSAGSPVLFAPLPVDLAAGWTARAYLQNLSPSREALVRFSVIDRTGEREITAWTAQLCRRGSATFAISADDYWPQRVRWPGLVPGLIRVESLAWRPPGARGPEATNLAGTVELVGDGPAREAMAFEMLPEQVSFDWPNGYGRGGVESGQATLSIGSFDEPASDSGSQAIGRGRASRVVVANVVPWPGETLVQLAAYDHNGLVSTQCRRIGPMQLALFEPKRPAGLGAVGWTSAVASAVTWTHRVAIDIPGQPHLERPLVGLAAVVQAGGVDPPSQTAMGVAADSSDRAPGTGWGDSARAHVAWPVPQSESGFGPAAGSFGPDPASCAPAVAPLPAGPPPGLRVWLPVGYAAASPIANPLLLTPTRHPWEVHFP